MWAIMRTGKFNPEHKFYCAALNRILLIYTVIHSHRLPRKLREGSVLSRVCPSVCSRFPCDHYPCCIGPHCTAPPHPHCCWYVVSGYTRWASTQYVSRFGTSNGEILNKIKLHLCISLKWSKALPTQECIPVGCIPSAAVPFRGGGVWPGGYKPPPSVDGMTDACENITFPQLLLRTVKIQTLKYNTNTCIRWTRVVTSCIT